MMGQHPQAIECLKECAGLDFGDARLKVDNLANGLREPNPVQSRILNSVNMSAVYMCSGQLELAKQTIDSVLEALDLKLQTTEQESKQLMPAYLVNLLVYFYMKTKNYKMAR